MYLFTYLVFMLRANSYLFVLELETLTGDNKGAKSDKTVRESTSSFSPESKLKQKGTSRATPVSRRTRKNTRIQKKKTFLDHSNDSWRIGQAPGEGCHSCKKSKHRVIFTERGKNSSEESCSKRKEKMSKQAASCLKKPDIIADIVQSQTMSPDHKGGDVDLKNCVSQSLEVVAKNQATSNPLVTNHALSEVTNLGSLTNDTSAQTTASTTPAHTVKFIPSTPRSSSKHSWISCTITPLSNRLATLCVNSPNSTNKRNAKGETALHVACIKVG